MRRYFLEVFDVEDAGLVFVEVVEGAEDGAEVRSVAVSGEVEAGLEVEFVDLGVELDSEEGHEGE